MCLWSQQLAADIEAGRLCSARNYHDSNTKMDLTHAFISPEQDRKDRQRRIAESLSRVTQQDYDDALEARLREVREERGYTTREPSEWRDTDVPRWQQDAKDWLEFRDRVMLFGLDVQNKYASGGVPPMTLDEFKDELKKMDIVWTYKED